MEITKERVLLDLENKFSQDKFTNPPADCAPVFTWEWVTNPSHESTDKALEDFKKLGIKTIYILPLVSNFRACTIPSALFIDYMGKEYMEQYVYAVNKAIEMGFRLWIYDEAGWPSGSAAHKVLYDHPEYSKKILAARNKEFKKGDKYIPQDDCAAFLNGKMIDEGYVFTEDSSVTEYYSHNEMHPYPGYADYPDLTLKAATDYFLEVTHDEYKKHLGDKIGKNIPIVFTDEAVLPYPTPYRPELEAEFERREGYSIRPYLPILNKSRQAETEEEGRAVVAWYEYCSELFCENFLEPYKNWCHDNGVAFSGHFNIDHIPNGSVLGRTFNLMRALRYLDVPGIDAIWRQIFPCEKVMVGSTMTGENRFYPRYASSAASQIGSPRAMTESFGVYGSGVTFDEMRYVINFQSIRGINLYNLMLCTSDNIKGFQLAGELPNFHEKFACYSDLKHFNSYMERVCYLTSLGKTVTDTALYLPVRDLYLVKDDSPEVLEFDRVGFSMEDKQIYFDIFDDDVILGCDKDLLKKGKIVMGDACYTKLILTEGKYMKDETVTLLEEFIRGGGRVITTREYIKEKINGAIFSETCTEYLASPLTFKGDTKGIRLMQRKSDNADLYYISNENYFTSNVTVEVKAGGYLINATSGDITRIENNELTLEICSGEMFVIMYTDEEIKTVDSRCYSNEINLDGKYTVKRTKQFVLGDMLAETVEHNEEETPCTLGDWRGFAGDSYSGSCVYKTTFRMDNVCDCVLDLGKVSYTCEAFINGKSLGVKVTSPYRYNVPKEILNTENTLEIRVTNTPANEYYYTKTFEKWAEWQLTPYFKFAQVFHESSLPSGLFGPVKIKF